MTTQSARASMLTMPDSQFDVVLCQQAIMFFPDRVQAVREMHRALKPGGRVGLNVWRTPQHNPTFDCLIKAREKHAGHDAADFMRSPFVMRSVSEMRSVFEQAAIDVPPFVVPLPMLVLELRTPQAAGGAKPCAA